MRKGNLIKLAAPAILSAAMMVSGLPVGVMAADFTEGSAVEATRQHHSLTKIRQQKMNLQQKQQRKVTNMFMLV